jgi:serine/threonine protein kinase
MNDFLSLLKIFVFHLSKTFLAILNQMEDGSCACGTGTIEMGNKCMDSGVFAAIIVSIIAVLVAVAAYFFWRWRRAKNDEAWQVKVEELHFGQHAEVIGQGSFGVVLLAEYRGTKVAIKRVLPIPKALSGSTSIPKGTVSGSRPGSLGGSIPKHRKQSEAVDMCGNISPVTTDSKGISSLDVEAQRNKGINSGSFDPYRSTGSGASGSECSTEASDDDGLSFLGHLSYGRARGRMAKLFPWLFPDNASLYNASILGTASGGSTTKTFAGRLCPCFDSNYKRQQEFMEEMRLLSRLRHPCITTVMGATMARSCEPMMVSYHWTISHMYYLS